MTKKVLGIAMGGHSSEREISLESGNTVFKALSDSQWECFRIIVDKNHWSVIDPHEKYCPLDLNTFTFKIKKNCSF